MAAAHHSFGWWHKRDEPGYFAALALEVRDRPREFLVLRAFLVVADIIESRQEFKLTFRVVRANTRCWSGGLRRSWVLDSGRDRSGRTGAQSCPHGWHSLAVPVLDLHPEGRDRMSCCAEAACALLTASCARRSNKRTKISASFAASTGSRECCEHRLMESGGGGAVGQGGRWWEAAPRVLHWRRCCVQEVPVARMSLAGLHGSASCQPTPRRRLGPAGCGSEGAAVPCGRREARGQGNAPRMLSMNEGRWRFAGTDCRGLCGPADTARSSTRTSYP